MSDDREMRALERVTREAREEPTPDLDWDRVEARLMKRVDAEKPAATPAPGRWRVVAALAAAAVIALFVGNALQRAPAPTARAPEAPAATGARVFGASGNVDGADLRAGDGIVADGHAVTVDHPGRARWTLETAGRAVVADTGDYLTIKLDSGALSAHVVPSSRPETFAVEVGGARVAVHGTAFRVERQVSGNLRVEVSEGVVAVGPAGRPGHTEGWLLRRGDSGEFKANGKSGHVVRAETASASEPAAAPSEPSKAPVAVAPKPSKPLSPGERDLGKGVDTIESAVRSCYGASATSAGGDAKSEVRVRFTTELGVVVGPDGRVRDTRFEPPLAPQVMSCVKGAAAGVKFPESQQGATTTRSLLLGN
jgi:ferric-dicitrate binding protein FerR (iron transport regulator)